MTTTINESAPVYGVAKVTTPVLGELREIEVNFDTLKAIEPVRVGSTYPDLESQAIYSINGIERVKDDMLTEVSKLLSISGASVINTQLDAIVDCLTSELQYAQDNLGNQSGWFNDIHGKVYTLVNVAKTLIWLSMGNDSLKSNVEHIKHAQKGIKL